MTTMVQNNRTKLILLIVVILTIINLAAIITVMINIRSSHQANSDRFIPGQMRNDSLVNAAGPMQLCREVGFSDEQELEFRESRIKFRESSKPLFLEIRQLNKELIDEIVKENPDSLKLEQLSTLIGEKQARVKQFTIRHLLEVKSIATPEQQEKLKFFYRELLSRDSGPSRKGIQNQHRHGQRMPGNE